MKDVYGFPGARAWQFGVGCSASMPCSKRCWARKTVARIVECQRGAGATHEGTFSPDRSAFFAQALTPDLKQWSGKVFLDEKRLMDPLKWRKPALIAGGFHCDWARLSDEDKDRVMAVAALCSWHTIMLLSKCPEMILRWAQNATFEQLRTWMNRSADGGGHRPGAYSLTSIAHAMKKRRFRAGDAHALDWDRELPPPVKNVTLGVSIMDQADADRHLSDMKELAAMGWRTHVWHEPAIGPVNWAGWEFIELLITGGESGSKARPFDIQWGRDDRDWAAANGVKFWMKQLGSVPVMNEAEWRGLSPTPLLNCSNRRHAPDGSGIVPLFFKDRKGADWSEWSEDLRVREMPLAR